METQQQAKLTHWNKDALQRFLEIRQEFFLDPMGSNKDRFLEATSALQRALFDWYLTPPGNFKGMLGIVKEVATHWSELRKEERRTLLLRRFALNNPSPDLPAVESSVSEHQWQKIFGSLGLGLSEPGTFDRFLVQLDEETNPSLRVNHRYMGELLPHDNMISYLSSITGTFLNENAIIGKVSPCVTHMEQAAVKWLITLIGWDGLICSTDAAETVPAQRLPTLPAPAERYLRWEREEPTGTIVAGGTIANISAFLIARSALFDYLLGWSGAVQWLGPSLAWDLVRSIWRKKRLLILTSKGAHYSISKAAMQAGVAPGNVLEIPGSKNPWILDGPALSRQIKKLKKSDLVLAVAAIAGKTETGYVDQIDDIAEVLNGHGLEDNIDLPTLPNIIDCLRDPKQKEKIEKVIAKLEKPRQAKQAFTASRSELESKEEGSNLKQLIDRINNKNEVTGAKHNRIFIHVDAAHGGAFLTIPELRTQQFKGIELADTVTLDGHKSFYCYYPCGGLLVRTTRWAQTFSSGHSAYISEDQNRGVYREGLMFSRALESASNLAVGQNFDGNTEFEQQPGIKIDETSLALIDAINSLTGRPATADRSELTHQPFNQYLEGSRGPQGIMQLYFNLATLGLRGYEILLGWTARLRERAEEAISLGMSDIRLVTDPALPCNLNAADKGLAIQTSNNFSEFNQASRSKPATVVPIAGGRFLRLSGGTCNQMLITYVPAREAKLIATASREYWSKGDDTPQIQRVMRYLWRINEHLWGEHIYANPHFTYYLGHTSLDLVLPSVDDDEMAAPKLATLFTGWNAWTRQRDGSNPFFDALADHTEKTERKEAAREAAGNNSSKRDKDEIRPYARKFFCHKVVTMHPYTDESLIGDMLRRLAFWGERSVLDVGVADARARFLFPNKPGSANEQE